MKSLILLAILSISTYAEICTSVIVDQGRERETFSRQSYSIDQACFDADWECRNYLFNERSVGRYQNANCQRKQDGQWPGPTPQPPVPPRRLTCETDIVDMYGNVVRQFTSIGDTEQNACVGADDQCKYELAMRGGYGMRCVTRGIINNPYPNPNPWPVPPRMKTETCTANRYDPAGHFVQTYIRTMSGPFDQDVKSMACNAAFNDCQRELVGRQFCNIIQ